MQFSLQELEIHVPNTNNYWYRKISGDTKFILIADAPEVTITQEDSMTIEENDDLVLNCVVSAKPDATVKWYRGKVKRQPRPGAYLNMQNFVLRILKQNL